MPDTLSASAPPRTAVIDVGSNSVRLVIFGDSTRAPLAMLNEKAFCLLGAGLNESGKLNAEGRAQALLTLKRFWRIADSVHADRILAFATAAVREAEDGPEFVRQVREQCGLELRVLSGEEEANLAGMGVLFGIPEADGIVIDMGGSSLELAPLNAGQVEAGVSLPLGPLQIPEKLKTRKAIIEHVEEHLEKADWLRECRGRNLYLVGGTWRAFAKLDISMRNYDLNVIQGYEMSYARARTLTELVSRQSQESLRHTEGVSSRRLKVLPVTSIVLDCVLRRARPRKLVFSAHGVREGIYFSELPDIRKQQDPLLEGIKAISRHETRFHTNAGPRLFDWMSPLFGKEKDTDKRLRQAACMLADVGWRTHPDYRATQSFRRILRAPLLGISHAERTFLAIALMRRYSQNAGGDVLENARALLEDGQIRRAIQIGAAIRLTLTLTEGDEDMMAQSSLSLTRDSVRLSIMEADAYLDSEATRARLKNLATAFERDPVLVFVKKKSPGKRLPDAEQNG